MTDAATDPSAERAAAFQRQLADANALAAGLGSPAEWLASALEHLRERSSGHSGGGARVSIAALRLALDHLARLERAGGEG